MKTTREWIAITLTAVVSIVILSIVGTSMWSVIQAVFDWRATHIAPAANPNGSGALLANIILTLVGTLLTGVVGYIGVTAVADKIRKKLPPAETPIVPPVDVPVAPPPPGKSLQEQAMDAIKRQ